MANYPDLTSKHVLITGGAGGIGEGATRAFAQQGSRVSFIDIDAERGHALQKELRQSNEHVTFFEADLTDESALMAAIDNARESHGPIDVLINNAGYDPRYPIDQTTTQQWDDLFALNVKHYFIATRQVVPEMKQRNAGSIIMVASCQYWVGDAEMSCYTATKAAIMGMVKSLARELGPHNIRVNAIAPGWIMTDRQLRDVVTPEYHEKLLNEWQCLPYELKPADIAPAFLFLASDAARAITRQTLLVDAGYSPV